MTSEKRAMLRLCEVMGLASNHIDPEDGGALRNALSFEVERLVDAGDTAAHLCDMTQVLAELAGVLFYYENQQAAERIFLEGQMVGLQETAVTVAEYGKIAFQFN